MFMNQYDLQTLNKWGDFHGRGPKTMLVIIFNLLLNQLNVKILYVLFGHRNLFPRKGIVSIGQHIAK